MNTLQELITLERLLAEFEFPISPILQYAIQEKKNELIAQETKEYTIQETTNIYNDGAISAEDDYHPITSRKKSSRIRVQRDDGSYIQEKKANVTFTQTIKEIGASRVEAINIYMDSMNIITAGGNPQYPSAQHKVSDNWYVNTHSNTLTKKRQLETIFKALNMNWRVEIIDF